MDAILPTAPPSKGEEVDLHIFIDRDHSENKQTKRSMTRFVIYMNMSLIIYYSKRQ